MNTFGKFSRVVLFCLLSVFLLTAYAEEGGGGGKSDEKSLYAKVEPITVNLAGGTQYLQVEITLALAKPEVGDKVKKYMSVIRNNLIYLLTSKDAGQLQSTEGKQMLAAEARSAVNNALELSDKEGVTNVFFGSFIIQ
jgi:flagellar FliL protein